MLRHTPYLRRFAAVFGLLLTIACGADEQIPAEAGQSASAGSESALDVAGSLGVYNARMPQPGLITAGQLTQEQFDAMAAAGVTNFISLRLSGEDGAGWEEAHASGVGATFARLPVEGGAGLTRANAEELARLLDAAGDDGTVLYCGSSNRVGALLALKAFWVDGASPEDALAVGRAGGMTRLESTVAQMLESSQR